MSLPPPETQVGTGGSSTSPGVQKGCPEWTGPNHSVRMALVHSALTCCRVSGASGTHILSFLYHPEAGRPVPPSLSPSTGVLFIVFDRFRSFLEDQGLLWAPHLFVCCQEALAVVALSLGS